MAAQRPPFTATDLQMLFKKICAGVFPRIPGEYSNSLAGVIASLLKISPGDRPTADRLLNNPVVQGHYKGEETLAESWAKEDLLSTIVFNSRNWKDVNKVLPKAQYQKRSSKELVDPKQNIVEEMMGNKENTRGNTGSGKRERSSSTYVGVSKIESDRERIISVIDNIQKQCKSNLTQATIWARSCPLDPGTQPSHTVPRRSSPPLPHSSRPARRKWNHENEWSP